MSDRRPLDSTPPRALAFLWRFRVYGQPFRARLAAGIGFRVAKLIADLATPWPLAILVDGVIGGRHQTGLLATVSQPFSGSPNTLLLAAATASVVLAALSGMFDYLGHRVMNRAGERITAVVRADLFSHLQRLPLAYHDSQSSAELASRVAVDTDNIGDAVIAVFSTLLPGLLTVGGMLTALLLLSWPLGLVAFGTAPIVFVVAARYTSLAREAARVRRASEGTSTGFVAETLAGIRTVHALGRQDLHDERFRELNQATLDAGLRAVTLRARFSPVLETAAAVGGAGLLCLGAWGVLGGQWTLGVLLVAAAYLRDMLKPMRSLSEMSLSLSRVASSAERVTAVLETPLAGPSITASAPLPSRAAGNLELVDVGLDYGRSRVLDHVSLRVEAGERLAFVGAAGAGKSSVLALLAGLYVPSEGAVLLDGRPICDLPQDWVREQIAVVPQDAFMFAGSLWDNLAYGRPTAAPDEIASCASAALVADFVLDLPDGYNTMIGDGGIVLTSGQRQRVAIARALLRNAPVVLLDEPTSDLDATTEDLVVQALEVLMAGRTVVMATQRPVLLKLADRIAVLEGGVLVEGTTSLSTFARTGPKHRGRLGPTPWTRPVSRHLP
jgi:ATP-binding cassette subfamily B protein